MYFHVYGNTHVVLTHVWKYTFGCIFSNYAFEYIVCIFTQYLSSHVHGISTHYVRKYNVGVLMQRIFNRMCVGLMYGIMSFMVGIR